MENITKSTDIYQVKNERMGGFVPSWDGAKPLKNFDNILSSYNAMPETVEITPSPENKEFGFFDIIDMVNPLQHIPLVNIAYRSLTGDEIKPVSKIIGGSIFGGAMGAVSGIMDVVIKDATGKDMVNNVKSFAGINNDINNEYKAYKDLPAALLSFAQMPMPTIEEKSYERTTLAQGRTAGTIAIYS